MKVAVLGSGPAGLMAMHAVAEFGAEVEGFSLKERSVISGAQYLHEPIPGINADDPIGQVSYAKLGSGRGYAAKVYGHEHAPTSWDVFPFGDQPAWSLQAAYDRLADRYWGAVHQRLIEPDDIEAICTGFDLVFSTVPANRLCYKDDHQFVAQEITVVDVAMTSVDNMIIYNGRAEDGWYRTSNLFGHCFTEWSSWRPAPAGIGARKGTKPISTDCTCHLEHKNFWRMGRFGKWKKGVLTSDAYKGAWAVAEQLGQDRFQDALQRGEAG